MSQPRAVNLGEAEWESLDRAGFGAVARLGRPAGSEHLGLSAWRLAPGEAAYPYHYHLAEEELIVVLEGGPELRGPDGRRELEPGEVVAFPVGDGGAHQLSNPGNEPVLFLAFGQRAEVDVAVYPDSGKLYVRGARLPSLDDPDPRVFRLVDAIDYWEGESR